MKNQIKAFSIAMVAFAIGFGANQYAISNDLAEYKIAIVDVSQVVTSSSQVKALKTEQQNKIKDLRTFIQNAKKDVSAQTDEKKKKELEEKYSKELTAKKEVLDKEYSKKLADIDKNISTIIEKEAKAKEYNLVLAKGVVLYGGEDITQEITKLVK